ncbi:hypothetical protein Esi_0037_0037 [Ectocarpus siliculosus]|uniref:Uncharacterized protein n=1 Tax=Ectocarpus siliculosus TaxID=2880 RepID=D8LLK9_ECTSI|nr:hypothetical protein Esi_0037_0037 [Ectocarpus siliculosus]|eukprot:CBN74640.1 hypothetical protein Esi_0037_0037 [Ectocarpus siliculosus]
MLHKTVRVLLISGHVACVIRLWHIRCRRASVGALEEAKLLAPDDLQYTREPLQYQTSRVRGEPAPEGTSVGFAAAGPLP